MATCNPCITGTPVDYTDLINCNVKKNIRKAGIGNIAFLKCDITVNVLTDASEWTAIRTAATGNIIRVPSGFGTLPKPNTTKAKLASGCSPEEVTDVTQQLTFKTHQYDNDTFIDSQFLCDINGTYQNYTLVWTDCNNILYFSDQWVSGDNPGFDNISLFAWDEIPEDGLQSINFEIEFKLTDRCIKKVKISDAVKKAIFG